MPSQLCRPLRGNANQSQRSTPVCPQALIRRGSDPPAVDLLLERAAPGAALLPYNPATDLMVFVKALTGAAVPEPIKYMGHIVLRSTQPLRVGSRPACAPACLPCPCVRSPSLTITIRVGGMRRGGFISGCAYLPASCLHQPSVHPSALSFALGWALSLYFPGGLTLQAQLPQLRRVAGMLGGGEVEIHEVVQHSPPRLDPLQLSLTPHQAKLQTGEFLVLECGVGAGLDWEGGCGAFIPAISS